MPEFTLGEALTWTARVRPYERRRGDPPFRRLRIFAIDPAASRLEGAVAEVPVPYEPLEIGPRGAVLAVVDRNDSEQGPDGGAVFYRPVDLESPPLLLTSGLDPSPGDWRSHQQMVYAVAARLYGLFRDALGRDPSWGFEGSTLRLRPHAFREANAWYDRDAKEVAFGYFMSRPSADKRFVESIFTCLSHDVVAHEVSHALLDGMRRHYMIPTRSDVLGFHEGFSDIVALLNRFNHREVVRAAMGQLRGRLANRSVLSQLAQQFGRAVGLQGALRKAVTALEGGFDRPERYHPRMAPHDQGEVLLGAVFEAFERIYRRRSAHLFRLATGGTGELPRGEIPHDLAEALTDLARSLADQFLRICIRAVDYCPPVDLELGEYLRALITADRDLVPDDPWGYRETLIDTFRRRDIHPPKVTTFSEEGLRWRPPTDEPHGIRGLRFGELRFAEDPGRPAHTRELRRQATRLGEHVCDARRRERFGLEPPGRRRDGALVGPPCVESVRTVRRVSPSGAVAFDLVGEVVQKAVVPVRDLRASVTLYGGATVIVGSDGAVRYAIVKRALKEERVEEQLDFIREQVKLGERGVWQRSGRALAPRRTLFRIAHEARKGERQPSRDELHDGASV